MAIQISDKLLSEKAKKALNNSISKSQFLRDAIEFYVNSMDASNTDNFSIQGILIQQIEELKKMITLLTTNKLIIETNENKEISKSNLNNIGNKGGDIKKNEVIDTANYEKEQVISMAAITESFKEIEANRKEENDEYDDIPECFK